MRDGSNRTSFILNMRCPIVGILAVVERIGGYLRKSSRSRALVVRSRSDFHEVPSEFWNAGILSLSLIHRQDALLRAHNALASSGHNYQ